METDGAGSGFFGDSWTGSWPFLGLLKDTDFLSLSWSTDGSLFDALLLFPSTFLISGVV